MNLRVFATSLVVLAAVAFLGYGFHQYVNAALGLKESPLDSAWQSLAIAVGLSIVAGITYPHLRGVRKGDMLLANVPRAQSTPTGVYAFIEQASVTALENGRVGQRVKVKLTNGRTGEGIVQTYAGTFSSPTIQITETEAG